MWLFVLCYWRTVHGSVSVLRHQNNKMDSKCCMKLGYRHKCKLWQETRVKWWRVHRHSVHSQRVVMCVEDDWQQSVMERLKNIVDPDLNRNIVDLGFVRNLERVATEDGLYDIRFTLQLTTPACPVKEKFRQDAKDLVSSLSWVRTVEVELQASETNKAQPGDRPLSGIRHIIAVASCKGGVGKSTVAVNLAFTLAKLGGKVGIMDADIYGPSLPILVQPENRIVQYKDGRIMPLQYQNVKLMSFGYINPESAIMRGPMIANMMKQLLMDTDWGALDYLVIDMPPGTGDIQLTICQTVSLDAAVIVTTPQQLSVQDVVKGIYMFDKVSVPCVALVENMAYFEPSDIPNKRYYLFGKGKGQKIADDYGIPFVESFPVDPELCHWSDSGVPAVLASTEPKYVQLYVSLASAVIQQVAKNAFGNSRIIPQVTFDNDKCVIVISSREAMNGSLTQMEWSPWELRKACKCALCVDELTGKERLQNVDKNVRPVSRKTYPFDCDLKGWIVKIQIQSAGNYAFSVAWSDGHQSLYPFQRVMNVGG